MSTTALGQGTSGRDGKDILSLDLDSLLDVEVTTASKFAEKLSDGAPKFGPESPIATEAACKAVGGVFHLSLFGWMLHANVYEGDDLATIYGDDHSASHTGK